MTMEEQVKKNAGYSLETKVSVSNEIGLALIDMIGVAIGKAFAMAERSERRADERHSMHMAREQLELDEARARSKAKA
jgi:hypothetical protein